MFDLNNSHPTNKEINEALEFDKEYKAKFGISIFENWIGIETSKQYKKLFHLNEMARIDDPRLRDILNNEDQIWIYGNDRTAMTPHFHYKNKEEGYELEIDVKTLRILFMRYKHTKTRVTWNDAGMNKLKKRLLKWFKSPSMPSKKITNYEQLIVAWNQNNWANAVDFKDCIQELLEL